LIEFIFLIKLIVELTCKYEMTYKIWFQVLFFSQKKVLFFLTNYDYKGKTKRMSDKL